MKPKAYVAVMQSFVSDVEAVMKYRSVNRTELARCIGVEPPVITRLFNDPGNATVDTLVRIAEALQLHLSIVLE